MQNRVQEMPRLGDPRENSPAYRILQRNWMVSNEQPGTRASYFMLESGPSNQPTRIANYFERSQQQGGDGGGGAAADVVREPQNLPVPHWSDLHEFGPFVFPIHPDAQIQIQLPVPPVEDPPRQPPIQRPASVRKPVKIEIIEDIEEDVDR